LTQGGSDNYALGDGANIAVIGGGPSGSFFSIFALKMARMLGQELNVTIFEPRDFTKTGPGGCNRCGGIISELLVQTLAIEGINLPDTVVRKGINSYKLHTEHGSVFINTPSFDKTIATVSRGGGPMGIVDGEKESFDQFLLSAAEKEGAVRKPLLINHIEYRNGMPVLFSQKQEVMEADVVVGAFGVNSATAKLVEGMDFGYREPPLITAAIAELGMDPGTITERFGNSIHLFLIPDQGIKFAAMIPKGAYVTLCVLGSAVASKTINDFLKKPVVRAVLPDIADYRVECRCLPKMNIGAPKKPFTDRMVMCGDAGSTRLFKDGLGAAYLMGKAAANTVMLRGVSERDFRKGYLPIYKSIVEDNYFGRYLYAITDLYRKNGLLTKGMLRVVRNEQNRNGGERVLSSILWDMFTGNERYKRIIPRALSVKMHLDLWKAFAGLLAGLD
jgi:flavin-dependent dehydrogenase